MNYVTMIFVLFIILELLGINMICMKVFSLLVALVSMNNIKRNMSCFIPTEMLYAVPECPLKQYIGIGTMGLVQCSFNESFLAVTWYNVNERRPILLYKDGVKSGDGYHSGEFDIHPNGSLVINNVGVEHESVYSVSKAISASEPTVSYAISVYTTGKYRFILKMQKAKCEVAVNLAFSFIKSILLTYFDYQ